MTTKVTRVRDRFVIVTARGLSGLARAYANDAEVDDAVRVQLNAIVDQIRRHVDDVGTVTLHVETEDVCATCGREWEEDDEGAPTCCGAAVTAWESTRSTPPATEMPA